MTQIRALTVQIMIYQQQKTLILCQNFWKNMQKLKNLKFFLENLGKNLQVESWKKIGHSSRIPRRNFWYKNDKKRCIFAQIRALRVEKMIFKQKKNNFEPKFREKQAKIKNFEIFFGKSRKKFTSQKLEKNWA